jgi:hypothetical protein
MTLKVGLPKNLDVDFTFTAYVRSGSHARLVGQTAGQPGFDEVFAGLTYHVYGDDGGQVTLKALSLIKFPTIEIDAAFGIASTELGDDANRHFGRSCRF